MNLKFILNDYLDFLEERGIKFPENYSFKNNDDILQRMKLILEDVDYDFILDVVDDFYDALKKDLESAEGKVCVKFANRIVVGTISNINYETPEIIRSIDLVDKTGKSLNIRFKLIYSIEAPKKAEEVKKEKAVPKKDPEKHVIRDRHKYDEFIEPDLMHTRQLKIVDVENPFDEDKKTLTDYVFSKTAVVTCICLLLLVGAVFAAKYSIASINNQTNGEVVCIDGYEEVNGECLIVTSKKEVELPTEETTLEVTEVVTEPTTVEATTTTKERTTIGSTTVRTTESTTTSTVELSDSLADAFSN